MTPFRYISVYSWLRSDIFRFIRDSADWFRFVRDSAQTDFGLFVTPLRHISVYSWLRSNRFRFICDSVQTYFGLFVTPIRQISVYSWLRSDRFRFIREYVQTDFTVYWFLRCTIKHQILLRNQLTFMVRRRLSGVTVVLFPILCLRGCIFKLSDKISTFILLLSCHQCLPTHTSTYLTCVKTPVIKVIRNLWWPKSVESVIKKN